MIKNIRAALHGFLVTDAAITAVAGTRVYPTTLPEGVTAPSIVYNRVTGQADYHMQGASGLVRPRFQIDAWASTADQAAQLADLVKDRIDGFQGTWSSVDSPPSVVIRVQGVFMENERDDYQADIQMHRMSRDYLIWFGEV